jgi:hypothetical protein
MRQHLHQKTRKSAKQNPTRIISSDERQTVGVFRDLRVLRAFVVKKAAIYA